MTMVAKTSPGAGAKLNRQQRRQAARVAKKGRRSNGAAAPTNAALQEAVKLHKAGHPHEALQLYRKILAVRPDQVDALNLGGVANLELNHIGEAVKLLQAAVRLQPSYAEAHNNLGNALQAAGRLDEAAAAYRRAVGIKPGYAEAHYNLGILLQKSNDTAGAVAAHHRAIEINPNFAEAYASLGVVLHESGEFNEAIAACRRAIKIQPDYAPAHNTLGNALLASGKTDASVRALNDALEIEPAYADAHSNLARALSDQGRLDETIEAYRNALKLKPNFAKAHSNLIFTMNYHARFTVEDILAESRHWDQIHALPLAVRARPHANARDPERRLRIGYVSPDFCTHSVSYFIEPLLANHDRDGFEVFCYAEVHCPDAVTTHIRTLADGWRSTVGLPDAKVADRIREDRIDILVDLAGHSANNRLPAFAERPAPIQVTWLGYPNTTGMSAIDYRLSDEIADPEGVAEAHHSEALVRLPGGFLCYGPPATSPEVTPPPAAEIGQVTFGSFNNLTKVTPEVVKTWARILKAVPGSRIMIKSKPLADETTRAHYLALFAGAGIEADRIELISAIPLLSNHLAAYGKVDIGLDPFPYNGTTTTCEALWMGVPVITLCGTRHAARVGASLLTAMGLTDFIANTSDGYVETAADLAKNIERLANLRQDLRPRMAASPLCDAETFAGNIETTFRDMWRRWCAAA